MVDPDLIANKLAEVARRSSRVRAHAQPSATALAANLDALDLVSFNLMLVIQACADIASHLIADEGWPSARTLAEGFQRLSEWQVIAPATCLSMQRAAAFRNVVAHGYTNIDVEVVHRAVTESLPDVDSFAREVARWVAARLA